MSFMITFLAFEWRKNNSTWPGKSKRR